MAARSPDRPAGAPAGTIRAHMATSPASARRLREVVAAILPQVDRLTIVFNGYPEAPADLTADPRIEAITTDADTGDAGRFFSPPAADDIVFLIDDRLDYPADYVARSIDAATRIGWDGNVFGYRGLVFRDGQDGRQRGWRALPAADRLPKPRGVRMLGTGTALARGDAIPPIAFMLNYVGHADVGFALNALRTGRRAWALPRDEGWLADPTAEQPDDPLASPPLAVVAGLREIIKADLPHVDRPHGGFAGSGGEDGAAAKGR